MPTTDDIITDPPTASRQTDLQRAVVAAFAAGLSVLPPRSDGSLRSKSPCVATWTPYTTTRATPEQLAEWYGPHLGLGCVTGKVSGDLEVLDFDTREVYERFVAQGQALGLGDLIARIEAGYCEDTPAGGVHWLYRCSTITGNLKLARRPLRADEPKKHPKDTSRTLIETRGTGGYIVLAPSAGYVLRSGGFASIATISPDERHHLHQLARRFDVPTDRRVSPPHPTDAAADDVVAEDAAAEDVVADDVVADGDVNWADVSGAAPMPAMAPTDAPASGPRSALLDQALARLTLTKPPTTGTARDGTPTTKYHVVCPQSVLHGPSDPEGGSVLIVYANGALSYTCHHAKSCSNYLWADVCKALGITPEPVAREIRVALEADKIRDRRDAKRIVDAEERGALVFPEILTLEERLARPRVPPVPRLGRFQPSGTRVLLAAQFKSGKTTLIGNVIRSLVDGDPFLGREITVAAQGHVVLIDTEMPPDVTDGWLSDQHIIHGERVTHISLKGHLGCFNILNPEVRAMWAAILRDRHTGYLILDCLRPMLDGLGLDESHDAGKFLVPFDALLVEAGIPEGLIAHHMGHGSERTRGDSRLRDWPDVEWLLTRESDNPASARYLSAYGRDVNVPETKLAYSDTTRRLTLTRGSRRDAKAEAAVPDVLGVLRSADDALSGQAIETELAKGEHSRVAIRGALRLAARDGKILTLSGAHGARLHRLACEDTPTGGLKVDL
jgi:hypothetical protein